MASWYAEKKMSKKLKMAAISCKNWTFSDFNETLYLRVLKDGELIRVVKNVEKFKIAATSCKNWNSAILTKLYI